MASATAGRAAARRRSPSGAVRTATRLRRRMLVSPLFHLLSLTAFTVAISLATISYQEWVPVAAFSLVFVGGGFLLRPRELLLLYGVVAVGLVYVQVERIVGPAKGVVVVLLAHALLMWVVARSRARLGLQGTLGETMLVDLRDRLRSQGELPALPDGWQAETALKSAYGDSFSGDFLAATRSTDGTHLEVVLVDVSGKGAAAGGRSLLLSGAFGGLLGAMPAREFLHAANQYLLRQRWVEGFATAVHLDLNLVTGQFRLSCAGHPPPAHFMAGSGRWHVLEECEGPLLGVFDGADYIGFWGQLDRGDALMLYTDGVVETPDRDLAIGIDRMLGHAETLVRDGFRGGARRIVEQARAGESDDRALLLIWRD